MSLGSWREGKWIEFPGLVLGFKFTKDKGLVVVGSVINLPLLWEEMLFRSSGKAEYYVEFRVEYPVDLQITVGGEPVSSSFVDEYLRNHDFSLQTLEGLPIQGKVRWEMTKLMKVFFRGKESGKDYFYYTHFVPLRITDVVGIVGGISFTLSLYFPFLMRVLMFGKGRTTPDWFFFYHEWVKRIEGRKREVMEFADEFFSWCDEWVREVDFREILPFLPDGVEVRALVGGPKREVYFPPDPHACTHPLYYRFGGKPTIEFSLRIPSNVVEGFRLGELIGGRGNPFKILSLLGLIVSLFPSFFEGSDEVKGLFLTMVNVLLEGG